MAATMTASVAQLATVGHGKACPCCSKQFRAPAMRAAKLQCRPKAVRKVISMAAGNGAAPARTVKDDAEIK